MKYNRFLVQYSIIIISFSCLIACYKITDKLIPHSIEALSLITDTSTAYNSITLIADQCVSPTDSTFNQSLVGGFRDSATGGLISMGSLDLSAPAGRFTLVKTFVQHTDHTYDYGFDTLGKSGGIYNFGVSMLGATLKFKATGTSLADTVSQSIYMPQALVVHTADFPISHINRLNNLVLKWKKDASNSSGEVLIRIWYVAEMSRILAGDSTLPTTDVTLSYTVADSLGTYTVSSTDLQGFQVNSRVSITIGRGSEAIAHLPVSGKKVYFFAATSASTKQLFIQNTN